MESWGGGEGGREGGREGEALQESHIRLEGWRARGWRR